MYGSSSIRYVCYLLPILNPKPQCQVTNRPIFGTFSPSDAKQKFLFLPSPLPLSRVTDNPNPFCRNNLA